MAAFQARSSVRPTRTVLVGKAVPKPQQIHASQEVTELRRDGLAAFIRMKEQAARLDPLLKESEIHY
jgi:hypothetical protein